MEQNIEEVANSLENFSDSILKAYSDDRTLSEIWGWNFPCVNRHDLASIPRTLAKKIRESNITTIDNDLKKGLEDIQTRVSLLKSSTLPYFFNGHGNQAVPAFTSTMEYITSVLSPLFGWQVLQDNKAMPTQLARRLRSIQAEIDEIVPEKEELRKQITLIKEATETAESLPADLQSLAEARKKVDTIFLDSSEKYKKIDENSMEAHQWTEYIKRQKEEADKLVAKCEEAYRITTTKGLAGAFTQRADRLSQSMWVWVVGLLIALLAGVYIGAHRFELLSKAIESNTPQWGSIWLQMVLSVLSLGAPIWFAWIATKQISQRFRLSEDYAFKASVAKAYEGYRKEAARIDEAFEARLFSSALSRLEEAPLRLVETETHGSPWHELITSPQFQNAIQKVPELKDKFIEMAKNGILIPKSKDIKQQDEH